jgi:capsular polysaccharide biosynthesis protein
MDLLLIVTRIWRHKFITVPVIVLTIVGAAYAVAVKQPVYQVSASYLLVNPPAPPTVQQIAADPALGRVRAENPYTRFGNQPVMIDVLSRTLSSPTARQRLLNKGADPRYAVEAAMSLGFETPIVQITASGPTPEIATRTANIVSNAVVAELDRLQSKEQVDPRYRITAQQLQSPVAPQPQASGQVRVLVAVLAVGMILLFSAISVADALAAIRRERSARDVVAPDDLDWPDPDWASERPVATNGMRSKASAQR